MPEITKHYEDDEAREAISMILRQNDALRAQVRDLIQIIGAFGAISEQVNGLIAHNGSNVHIPAHALSHALLDARTGKAQRRTELMHATEDYGGCTRKKHT